MAPHHFRKKKCTLFRTNVSQPCSAFLQQISRHLLGLLVSKIFNLKGRSHSRLYYSSWASLQPPYKINPPNNFKISGQRINIWHFEPFVHCLPQKCLVLDSFKCCLFCWEQKQGGCEVVSNGGTPRGVAGAANLKEVSVTCHSLL